MVVSDKMFCRSRGALLFLAIIVILPGCKRARNNPYDPNASGIGPLTDTTLTDDPNYFCPSSYEIQTHNIVNKFRADTGGLNKLEWNLELAVAARFHSHEMLDNNYFEYESYDANGNKYEECDERIRRFGYAGSPIGENIAKNPLVDSAFDKWRISAGHRANMLNGNYNESGIGVVEGGMYKLNFTHDFGYRNLSFDLYVGGVFVGSSSGGVIKIRALVYQNGTGHCYPVKVSFYKGNPNSGGTLIGETNVAAIIRQGYYYASTIVWNYGNSGECDIYAKVDSDNHFAETDEENNVNYKHIEL